MPDRQIDLTGAPIQFPTVRLSNDFIVPWDRNIIIKQILKDTAQCPEYYNIKPASRDLAEEIAIAVESKIEKMKLEYLTGHLIRELTCVSLLELGYEEYANICSRVGTSVSDAREIDVGEGYGAKDNANLQGNPETSHKLKADKMSKEEYLAMMPPHLVEAHRDGRIHIHDLEYFGTRWFCIPEMEAVSLMVNNQEIRVGFGYFGDLFKNDNKELQLASPDGVQALTPNGWVNIKTVSRRWYKGDLIHITAGDLLEQARMTPEHRIFTVPDWTVKCAGDLTVKDSVYIKHIDKRSPVPSEIHILSRYRYEGYVYDLAIDIPDNDAKAHAFAIGDKIFVSNCQSWDLRYFLYYGLLPDGRGTKASVSAPAKRAEVAVLHAVKVLGSAQTNFAGGEGFYNFLTFLAPYFEGLPYRDILQLMQMFVYELTQMTVARGGQSLHYDSLICIKEDNAVNMVKIGDFCTRFGNVEGAYPISGNKYETLSLNRTTGNLEWKLLTGVYIHKTGERLITTTLSDGRSVTTTKDHSLFTLDASCNFIEISPSVNPDTIITIEKIPFAGVVNTDNNKHDFAIIKDYIKAIAGITKYESSRKLKKKDIYNVRHIVPDIYEKIKNILPMETRSFREELEIPEFVYDIGVKDNENFVLYNGIVAHNTVFSSVQLTPGVPNIWKDKPIVAKGYIYDGKQAPLRVYGEFEREVRLAFKAIMEIMLEGDYWGKPFNFPKPEIGIEHEFLEEDNEFQARNSDVPTRKDLYMMSFELASKFGTPYYDNMLPEYRGSGRGPACYQCIPGSTKVWHYDGDILSLKRIDVVHKAGMLVDQSLLTPLGTNSYQEMLVEPFSGNLIKITSESGCSLEMTPSHEMPIMRGNEYIKCRAQDLRIGDRIKVGGYLPSDNIKFRGAMSLLNIDPRYSNDFARWLGLYVAEGNILIRPPYIGGTRLQMSFNVTETAIADEAENLLKTLFKCKVQRKIIRNNEIRLLVYDKKLCTSLLNRHIPPRTGSQGWLPSCILTASNENKIEFLRAFFDGDGSYSLIHGHPRITFQVASDDIYLGLREMFLSLGFDPTGGKISTRDMYYLSLGQKNEINRFFEGDNFAISEDSKCKYKPIKKIESVPYSGLVYDPVNVEGHEFILGNGIISGNCCAYSFNSNDESSESLEQKMYFKNGAHFSMGAGQVITINVPRAAYEADHDDDIFFATLREYMDLAVEIFKIKRDWMHEIEMANRIPFAQQRPLDPHTWTPGAQAVDTKSLTYVIGIIGINEAMQYHVGKQLYEDKSALRFAIKTIVEMNQYAVALSKKYGFTIGVARTPAETTAQRFAVADLIDPRYSDYASKVVRGDLEAFENLRATTLDLPVYYTNGTHLPVNAPVGIPDRIMAEHVFFPLLAGGNILHVFMGEKAPDPGGLMDMAMRLAKNTQTGYFAFTRDLTVSMHRYHSFGK